MAIQMIQATNYRRGRVRNVRLGIIHTMEYPERPTSAEWCANYFRSSKAPMASAHYYVDADSTIQGVNELDTAYAAPGANADGIQLEHAGYAKQGTADWADAYSLAMLRDQSAPLMAGICARHDIPIRHLTDAQLRAGEAGLIGHVQASRVYKLSSHWDPGTSFPWGDYLTWVRNAAATRNAPASIVKPTAPAGPPTEPRGPFPLAAWHWYGVDDGGPRSHSGKRVADRFAIGLIQNKVKVASDGRFGPATARAVRDWQKAHGLTPDSMVGSITWAAM